MTKHYRKPDYRTKEEKEEAEANDLQGWEFSDDDGYTDPGDNEYWDNDDE